jgi:hypothetical protein
VEERFYLSESPCGRGLEGYRQTACHEWQTSMERTSEDSGKKKDYPKKPFVLLKDFS